MTPDTLFTDISTTSAFLRVVDSPIGRLYVLSNGAAITHLGIEEHHLALERAHERPDPIADDAASQLTEYFAGTRRCFDLPLEPHGTPFQQAVWKQLRDTPWGHATSYGAIGATIGRAAAGRAVGAAIAANPMPVLVPCHRVLAAGARITGYSQGAGVATKAWLLDHEGVEYRLPFRTAALDDELELARRAG